MRVYRSVAVNHSLKVCNSITNTYTSTNKYLLLLISNTTSTSTIFTNLNFKYE